MALRIDVEEEGKRRGVPLSGSELTIGRGADNSIVINDPRSSRHHCRLVRTPQGVLLEDMESRNGTILNGVPVKKSLIKPGALFSIGSVRFRLLDGDGDDTPAAVEADVEESSEEVSLEDDSPELELDEPIESEPAAPAAARSVSAAKRPPQRTAPVEKAEKPAADASSRGAPRGAFLERMVKGKVAERIPIEKTSIVLGRGKDCDIVLDDKRASTRHARIVSEGGALYIEDLGSTNGTVLNNRAVKRAILVRGATIAIGNNTFRAVVPHSPGAAAVAAETASGAATGSSEEVIAFDAERFLEMDRSQHPALVGVLVLILAVVSYFTVDITRRLVRREDPDPRVETNRILNNWSFEIASSKRGADAAGGGAVPGWKIAAGDLGELRVSSEHAQHPGRFSLTVRSTGDEDVCRAAYETDLVLDAGRDYLLEGYAVNQGSFAAGLLVEWLRPSKDGATVVGRAFSDTARQAGEAVDIAQVVTAPAAASQARVSCFLVGSSGAATFDRVSFSSAPSPNAAAPNAPVALEKTLRAGAAEDPITVVLRPEGTFAAQRKARPTITSLWAGLSPEQDPHAYGPRLTSIRAIEGEAAAFTSEVPAEKDGRWVTVEARAAVSGQDVQFQWRTGAAEGQAAKSLCIYFELRDKSVPVEAHPSADASAPEGAALPGSVPPGAVPPGTVPPGAVPPGAVPPGAVPPGAVPPGAVPSGSGMDSTKVALQAAAQAEANVPLTGTFKDIVFGERDDRLSVVFSQPVKLSTTRHPIDPARRLLVAEGPAAGIDIVLAHGSRHEASLAHALALDAEAAFRAGHVGEAIQLLSSMRAQYPEEATEVQKADDRIGELRSAAQAEVKDLEAQLVVLRQTPNHVVEKLVLERAELVRARYQGTPEGTAAAGVLDEAKKLWSSLESQKTDEELQTIRDLARKHFAAGELGLAELYYRWVAEGDKEGSLKREAENVLKAIETRRTRDRNILLQ